MLLEGRVKVCLAVLNFLVTATAVEGSITQLTLIV